MSAIWGFYGKNITKEWIEEKLKAMQEEYECKCILDDIQTKSFAFGAFGCGLQYVTKESKKECIPLWDEEQQIVFNADCIVDNRAELMKELGINDSELPDGQLLYEGYKAKGMDFFKMVRGMFSVAVYDVKNETLYLAADQLSQRCIHYSVVDGICYYSTLIEPMNKAIGHKTLNEMYLKDFLVAPGMMPNIVPGETAFENVWQVKPGTYVEIKNGKCTEHEYWNLKEFSKPKKYRSAKACGKKFVEVYEKTVEEALRTDGNVSVCLSSGYDSSSVAALAAKCLEKEQKNLYTYTYVPHEKNTVKYQDYFIMDEQQLVEQLGKMYPNMKQYFLNNQGKNCVEEMEKILRYLEMPIKAMVNYPNLLEIYQKARENGSRVVLNGQYGNSTVSYGNIESALYWLYSQGRKWEYYSYLNGYCKKIVPQSRLRAHKQMKGYFAYADEQYAKEPELKIEISNKFVSEKILDNYPMKERFQHIKTIITYQDLPDTPKRRLETMCIPASYMYIGSYETKLGLAAGVVIRDPTRNLQMLEFCLGAPFEYFAYKGNVRWMIRGAMHDYLPSSYVDVWPRYGIQNGDWHLRIFRDWKDVKEKLVIRNPKEKSEYMNESQVKEFIAAVDEVVKDEKKADEQLENDLQRLLFLESLFLFQQNNKSYD